jgi:RNA polymerase sigma-70 factor (ECF subfamily)
MNASPAGAGADAEQSDEALMALVAAGNRQAFGTLIERHRHRVMRLAYTVTRNRSAAEDVVQEAFLRVWSRARGWHHSGVARFSGWLGRMTINLAIDGTRRRREEPLADEMPLDATASDDAVHATEIAQRIGRALVQLPDRQRTAFALCQIERMSNAEAAASLGVSVGALELLLVRARKSMRLQLLDMIEALR